MEAGGASSSVRHAHLLARMRKAVKWAGELQALCAAVGDARAQLEAEAYAGWMRGQLALVTEAWAVAQDAFALAARIYEQLQRVAPAVPSPWVAGVFGDRHAKVVQGLGVAALVPGGPAERDRVLQRGQGLGPHRRRDGDGAPWPIHGRQGVERAITGPAEQPARERRDALGGPLEPGGPGRAGRRRALVHRGSSARGVGWACGRRRGPARWADPAQGRRGRDNSAGARRARRSPARHARRPMSTRTSAPGLRAPAPLGPRGRAP